MVTPESKSVGALSSARLEDRRPSIGDVAYLPGYSEPPAFHRAFKGWNGIRPILFFVRVFEFRRHLTAVMLDYQRGHSCDRVMQRGRFTAVAAGKDD